MPISVFVAHSRLLLRTKPALKLKLLRAMHIDDSQKEPKVSWEEFLRLNQIFKYERVAVDVFISFFVRFFDPQLTGFVPAEEFEQLIDLMFDSGVSGGAEQVSGA